MDAITPVHRPRSQREIILARLRHEYNQTKRELMFGHHHCPVESGPIFDAWHRDRLTLARRYDQLQTLLRLAAP